MRTPSGPLKVALWIAGTRMLALAAMVVGTYYHRAAADWPAHEGELYYRQVHSTRSPRRCSWRCSRSTARGWGWRRRRAWRAGWRR